MNIIILGAGQVGSTVATELAKEESNEITVVDTNQQILSELQDRLDLREAGGADGLGRSGCHRRRRMR